MIEEKRNLVMRYKIKKVYNMIFKGMFVRDWMSWGTYGKSGKEPLKWVVLKDMSDEHIQVILDTQHQICNFYRREFKQELKLRKKHLSLSIKETNHEKIK